MENKGDANATQDFGMENENQMVCFVDDDVMTRRVKNRERQRRYRARKRLEADTMKASGTPHAHQFDVLVEPYCSVMAHHNYPSARVHCPRNWKRDARRANLCTSPQATSSSATLSGDKPESEYDPATSPISCSTNKLCSLGRRDWKADARTKRN